jgi:hypothetical protein
MNEIIHAAKAIQMIYGYYEPTTSELSMLETLDALLKGEIQVLALRGIFFGWAGGQGEQGKLLTPGDPTLAQMLSTWAVMLFLVHEMTHGAWHRNGLDDGTFESAIENELAAQENEVGFFLKAQPAIEGIGGMEDSVVASTAREAELYESDYPRWRVSAIKRALKGNRHYRDLPRRTEGRVTIATQVQ